METRHKQKQLAAALGLLWVSSVAMLTAFAPQSPRPQQRPDSATYFGGARDANIRLLRGVCGAADLAAGLAHARAALQRIEDAGDPYLELQALMLVGQLQGALGEATGATERQIGVVTAGLGEREEPATLAYTMSLLSYDLRLDIPGSAVCEALANEQTLATESLLAGSLAELGGLVDELADNPDIDDEIRRLLAAYAAVMNEIASFGAKKDVAALRRALPRADQILQKIVRTYDFEDAQQRRQFSILAALIREQQAMSVAYLARERAAFQRRARAMRDRLRELVQAGPR